MELSMSQQQIQTVSPQMAQSMEILQMSTLELKTYLENMAQENPVIELDDPVVPDEITTIRRELEWLENTKRGKEKPLESSGDSDREEDSLENHAPRYHMEETLSFFLKAQMYALHLSQEMETAVDWIIDNLDENGWYDHQVEDEPFRQELIKKALQLVQTMEPTGVGATGLTECLLLQLERLAGDHTIAKNIIEKYLEEVGKDHYNQIAKGLGVSQEKVRMACNEIRMLNPRPSAGFDMDEPAEYIQPDIVVINSGDHFELFLAESEVPTLHLNTYYCHLMKESSDAQVLEYLGNKIRQAKWLVQSIDQRKNTVLRCAEVILELQLNFFQTGKKLTPMTLKDVAVRVNVHESTVSRAIRGKYLQCSYGVFPISRFFSRNLGEGTEYNLTPEDAKNLLYRLIEQENKKRPLSDQQLCELMARENIKLSRRTVAKYRMALNIPSATGRRKL